MKIAATRTTADFASRERPAVVGAVAALFAHWRKSADDRALRTQLAGMDDAMLRDIGIADDEIWKVRQGATFTPRAWG